MVFVGIGGVIKKSRMALLEFKTKVTNIRILFAQPLWHTGLFYYIINTIAPKLTEFIYVTIEKSRLREKKIFDKSPMMALW